ncbi:reverse transcriptase domain-containing protein [Tanacetum coccineum]
MTWEQLVSKFLDKFFSPGRTSTIRDMIIRFCQKNNEPIKDAWIRFQDLIRQAPHHGLNKWLLLNKDEGWNRLEETIEEGSRTAFLPHNAYWEEDLKEPISYLRHLRGAHEADEYDSNKPREQTWMAFGGNTRDLGSLWEEADEITTLHQSRRRNTTQTVETASQILAIVSGYASDDVRIFETTSDIFFYHINNYAEIDINYAACGNLRGLSAEEAWETIKDCAQYAYDEPIGDLDMMNDKVDNPSSQSTQFEEYTPPLTYPEEVEETIGILMEVEPLDHTNLEDLGLNTCSHDLFLSSREIPSVDESEPQLLPNFSPLDHSSPYVESFSLRMCIASFLVLDDLRVIMDLDQVIFDEESLEVLRSRKAHLLEDKQIPSIEVFDEVSFYILFQALGWHLEEIHVTWTHFKKKRTRLQLYIKVEEEIPHRLQEPIKPLEWKALENKLKPSITDPPRLELKDLSEHLEYAFLQGDDQLPIVIASTLSAHEKTKLLEVCEVFDVWGIDFMGPFPSRLRLFRGKLKSRWYGPFTVSKDMRGRVIELCDEEGNEFIANKQRVKPYQKDISDIDKDDDIESLKSSAQHLIVNDFVIINIPEEDVETKQKILDPDDQPMWESAKTVAPTPNSAIVQLDVDDNFVINNTHLKMIWENKFDGILRTDPHNHICEFLAICDMFKYGETQSEAVKLLMFPLSLSDKAKTWFNELNEEYITLWEQMRRAFINIFFPPSLLNRLLLEIGSFSQDTNPLKKFLTKLLEESSSAKLQIKFFNILRTNLKEELPDMRNKYYNLRDNHASKNSMNDDTPMCKCHEANYIQSEGYQNRDSHDSYSHQSLYDPKSNNDSGKSLTKLNNDVKYDLEDFKSCIRSMGTVHDKLFDRDNGKTIGVLPNEKSKPVNQEP